MSVCVVSFLTVCEVRVISDSKEQQHMLKACHEGTGNSLESKSLGAHIGQDKTLAKILERYWWPGVRKDVISFVQTCERCQKASTRFSKGAPSLHSLAVPAEPWRQIGVDLCSLPHSSEGYTCMAVAVDYFTKWVEAEPLRSKSAESVAQFLFSLICRHGCSEIQINDQGREFVNASSTRLHELTGVKQRITSPYHPQSNGLTERNNRTIQNSLLKVLEEKEEDWARALPGVLFAFRTSKQKSTGCSPFFLMYGRQARLPIESQDTGEDEECKLRGKIIDDSIQDAITKRINTIEKLRTDTTNKVMDNITSAQDRQKRDYQKRHQQKKTFEEGESVLLWNLRRADRKGGKMKEPWLGPYTIHTVMDNGTYQLANKHGTILKQKSHGVNLKPHCKRQQLEPEDIPPQTDEAREKEEDPVCTGEVPRQVFSFTPTSAAWRRYHVDRLQLPKLKPMKARRRAAVLTNPKLTDSIEGDGNCFFRAMSLELTGTQSHHQRVRDALVAFLSKPANNSHFCNYIGNDIGLYLETSRMADNGVWATDVEIVAIATLLQTTVFVFTDYNGTRRWLPYKPLFHQDVQRFDECIYLANVCAHFERVIACC